MPKQERTWFTPAAGHERVPVHPIPRLRVDSGTSARWAEAGPSSSSAAPLLSMGARNSRRGSRRWLGNFCPASGITTTRRAASTRLRQPEEHRMSDKITKAVFVITERTARATGTASASRS